MRRVEIQIYNLMKYFLFFLFLCIAGSFQISAQNTDIVKGMVVDMDKHTPLPYTNIVVLHKNRGTVSNEKGLFSLDISELDKSDSLSFQYVGYDTKVVVISELDSVDTIFLKEAIINLSEAFVFSDPPDPEVIVKKVLENKKVNYKKRTAIAQTFIRWRNTSDIQKINLYLKKNSIKELDEESLKYAAGKIPKHNTSYTDFLVDLYFSSNIDDTLKIDPVKAVSLKQEEITELEQMAGIFEKLFNDTEENEYWKVKSGILSQKLDIDDEDSEQKKDSVSESRANTIKTEYYNRSIKSRLGYSSMDDKDMWDFLYHPGRYVFTLVGGAKVNGEDVYIIDFVPKKSGKYIGRVYISMNTYALIRADYGYAEGKVGRDFHLFGVGYTVNHFSGSVFFEKNGNSYDLKYFSQKTGTGFSVNRTVSLLKKRERFLFDKKLKEIKVKIDFEVTSEESVEVLIFDEKEITDEQFAGFKQKENMKIIYIDHFSDDLWKGYPIIEPTKRMREYKKQ